MNKEIFCVDADCDDTGMHVKRVIGFPDRVTSTAQRVRELAHSIHLLIEEDWGGEANAELAEALPILSKLGHTLKRMGK